MITRRTVLGSAAVGGIGIAAWSWTRPTATTVKPTVRASPLLKLSVKEALPYAASTLRPGAFPALLRDAYSAPITTGSEHGDLHAHFVVPAIVELARPFETQAQQLAALWCVQNTAAWLVTPEPPKTLRGAAPALADAMRHFDAAGAEAAVDRMTPKQAALALAPWTLRTQLDPHRVIHLAASTSLATPVDEATSRLMMRSVARHLAVLGRGERGESFRALWARRETLPTGRDGLDAGAAAEALSWARSGGDPEAAIGALNSGQQPRAMWAALVASTLEIAGAAPTSSGMGVHALTLLDAAATLADRAPGPRQRTLILLLAGQWLGDLRQMHADGALDLFGTTRGAEPVRELKELVGDRDADARCASWLIEGEPSARQRALLDWTRDRVVGRTGELHDYKYLAALPRVLARVPPDWQVEATALTAAAPVVQQPSEWLDRDAAIEALSATPDATPAQRAASKSG